MFDLVEKGGVRYLRSTNIKSIHGFSTRVGGVSTMEHTKHLNLAFGRGEDDATVLQNVKLFADAVGVDADKIISVPQVHSNEVRLVCESDAGEGVSRRATFSCDGYYTQAIGLPIAVKTADCVPILLEARDGHGEAVAVSAVHAGWRGTAMKIVGVAVDKLCELGVEPTNIYVAIGPCINECCYEVGEDFPNQIKEKLGQSYENKFIKRKENGSLFADLVGMNLEILKSRGVPMDNIDASGLCTFCDAELFYSHRRQNGIRGSLMSVISK